MSSPLLYNWGMDRKTIYFSAATQEGVVRYMVENNMAMLFSFYQPTQYQRFAKIADELGYQNKVMMDSGAFSARKGKPIDVDAYIAFINSKPKYVRFFVSVDVIQHDHNAKHLTMEEKCQISFSNLERIAKSVWCPELIAPVYHYGEPLWVLDKYLDMAQALGTKHICFGLGVNLSGKNSNPGDKPRQYAQQICAYIRKRVPDMWIHLLAYNHMKDLPYIDCNSSDSTGYSISARYGHIICPFGDLAISHRSKQSESHPHFTKKYGEGSEAELLAYLQREGWDYAQLVESTEYRACFNAWYIEREATEIGQSVVTRKGLF